MPGMAAEQPRKLGYDDYCKIPEDRNRHEIVDGVHLVSPAPLDRHQCVLCNLTLLLGGFLKDSGLGVLRFAPSDVLLGPHDVFQPDLYVVLEASYGRIGRRGFQGPPDLVVEVLSSGNTAHDLSRKLPRYELHGVPEYWAVDPANERVEVYRREPAPGGGTRFARPLVLSKARGEGLESPLLPGFQADLAAVFDPGPIPPEAWERDESPGEEPG